MVTKRNPSLGFFAAGFCALLVGCPTSLPPAPEITSASRLPNAKVGRPYSVSLKARGGEGLLSWSGIPPAGLKLTPESGQITGSPDHEGNFRFKVSVKDSSTPARSDSEIFALTISPNVPLAIATTSPLPSAGINQSYSKILEAIGAEGKLSWSSTNLTDEDDFTLNQRTGAMEGTPKRTGTFTFDVKVTDSANQCATKRFVLGILDILTASPLPAATEGQDYAPVILQAAGGNPPLRWAGGPPANLTLDPETGEIHGIPVADGDISFAVKVTDSSTPPRSVTKTFQLTVRPKQPGGVCTTHSVTMDNFEFTPKTLTIKACDTVKWEHKQGVPDGTEHTVTSDGGAFDSRGGNAAARMSLGQAFSHTFAATGSFPYHCVVHGSSGGDGMSGTISVTP